ncbi:hypothetical protein DFAR_3960023 [Desulfarculales bacterium]
MEVAADRETEYPCPKCGRLCKVHDFHREGGSKGRT